MKKWTSLAFTLCFLSMSSTGCFLPTVNFDPPPYMPVESKTLPKRVDKAFEKAYPVATIQRIESLIWPPSGEEHFRITFFMDGELMETRYREGGKEIQDSLRQLPADEKTFDDSSGIDKTKSN